MGWWRACRPCIVSGNAHAEVHVQAWQRNGLGCTMAPLPTWMQRSRAVALGTTPSTFCSAALALRYTCRQRIERACATTSGCPAAEPGKHAAEPPHAGRRHCCTARMAGALPLANLCPPIAAPPPVAYVTAHLLVGAAAAHEQRGVRLHTQRLAGQLHTRRTLAQLALPGWRGGRPGGGMRELHTASWQKRKLTRLPTTNNPANTQRLPWPRHQLRPPVPGRPAPGARSPAAQTRRPCLAHWRPWRPPAPACALCGPCPACCSAQAEAGTDTRGWAREEGRRGGRAAAAGRRCSPGRRRRAGGRQAAASNRRSAAGLLQGHTWRRGSEAVWRAGASG